MRMTGQGDFDPDTVIDFWFGDLTERSMPPEGGKIAIRWFGKDDATDADIREKFAALHDRLAADVASGWVPQDLTTRLAAVIALDQFPRNMFRGSPKMYESDPQALKLARLSLDDKSAEKLDLYRAMFLFMPLMHSEEVDDQRMMIKIYGQLRDSAKARNLGCHPFFEMGYNMAARHLEIVERFGRFPHRNPILGRQTTVQEAEFLKEELSSF